MPRKLHPHPLRPEECRALLEACGGGARGARNRALVVLLWRAGLRAREACWLEEKSVRALEAPEEGGVVRVERPKGWERGAPPREVGIDKRSLEIVTTWRKHPERRSKGGILFTTTHGEPLQTSYLRQLLPMLAKRAGIDRRVHPHALRHTFARELYDEGVGIVEIQLALGHSSVATTQRYLRSIGATEVVAATASRSW